MDTIWLIVIILFIVSLIFWSSLGNLKED